jgi:hypothetical protein
VPPLVDLLPKIHTYSISLSPARSAENQAPHSSNLPSLCWLLLPKMHDSPESGHSEPPSLEKDDYANETEKTVEVNVDELEPVVTPKTWVVVGARSLPFISHLPSIDSAGRFCRWAMAYHSGPFRSWPQLSLKSPRVSGTLHRQSGSFLPGHSPSQSAS